MVRTDGRDALLLGVDDVALSFFSMGACMALSQSVQLAGDGHNAGPAEAVPTRTAARPRRDAGLAFEALKADVGRQVQAPWPRALGKSAAEGPNDRLRPTSSTSARTCGGRRSTGLVVMDVFTREAAVEPLQNKNAETVGRATKRAAQWATSSPRWTGSCLRKPCTARSGSRTATPLPCGPGHPDAEEGPGHKGGAQGRAVERPLRAGGRGLQRAAPRDGARRARERGEAAGHGVQGPARQRRQVPAQQKPHRPARKGRVGRGRLPSADERGEELQPSVRRRAGAGGRGLHDRSRRAGRPC